MRIYLKLNLPTEYLLAIEVIILCLCLHLLEDVDTYL